jgi:23S rRNA pseudouridine1911/1915/1917 synthase
MAANIFLENSVISPLTFICNFDGVRLDVFLTTMVKKCLVDISRNTVQTLIREGQVKLNGIEIFDGSRQLRKKDIATMTLAIDILLPQKLKAINLPLRVLYMDEDVIVISKAAGMVTHPGAGNYDNTLANALRYHYGQQLSNVGGDFRPGIVHRLDRDTSGLMVIAKNNRSHQSLQQQLVTRQLHRTYLAIIWGMAIPPSGRWENFIHRNPYHRLKMITSKNEGKYALTHYITRKEFAQREISMVECYLDTGRTHQLRVQFAAVHHPLVGDSLYGGNTHQFKGPSTSAKKFVEKFPRQALHSKSLSFFQPTSGKLLTFEDNLPADMQELLQQLEQIC